MRDAFYFMWVYFFIIFCLLAFLAFPILFMLVGLLFGFFGIAFDLGTSAGELFIAFAAYPLKRWWFVFILNIILATMIVLFTDYAQQTKIYRFLKKRDKKKNDF